MQKKIRKYFLFMRKFHLKKLQEIVSVKNRILIISSQFLKKQSQDFAYHLERLFKPELSSQGSINMVKLLSFNFEQCFGPFTILLVERSSERRLLRHLSNHFFGRL